MAHAIITEKIVDGRKLTALKVTIKGDSGTAAELIGAIIFNASDFLTNSADNKLMEIDYDLNGFSAELFWYASSSVPLISLAKDHPHHHEWWDIGGLVNNGGSGRNGDITITSTGLGSSTKDGFITFYLMQRKVPILG